MKLITRLAQTPFLFLGIIGYFLFLGAAITAQSIFRPLNQSFFDWIEV